MGKKTETRSKVAITRGGRWEAKRVIKEGLDLIGGIDTVVKKGDTVLLKPNMGYPEPPGMPAWTCTTDVRVLTALTELCLEAGAKRVITGDGCAHGIKASYMFANTGVQQEIEKAGGEISYFDEEPFYTREVPGGILLKKQAIPKVVLDSDVIINVPKIKPTRVGKWTLGFKNMFGVIPQEERWPWHRMPEMFFLLTDLFRLVKPALTVMDGFVIQEGFGPRYGKPVDFHVIVMGRDPVATEAVTVSVIGHEPHEQGVLPVAQKYGMGTMELSKIDVRGESIESVRRYTKVAPGDFWINPSPNVVEYVGGACWGCGIHIRYNPKEWQIDKNKKYALIVGNRPRLPEKFTEDEIWVWGTCAVQSKAKILKACPKGVNPRFMGGCPPTKYHHDDMMKFHGIDHLPIWNGTNYVKE